MTVRITKPEFNLREKISELDRPTGIKGLDLMRSDTSQDARDLISAGRRNLIINGAMQIAQRGTSSTSAISGGTFVCDRFKTGGNGTIGAVTVSQTTTNLPAGFDHALRYECTTADTSLAAGDHLGIMYCPESQDLARIAKGTSSAKPITLSFYVRSNVQKTFVVELTDSSNSRHVNFQKIVTATNTWERMVINIPADTSGSFGTGNNQAGEINWWLAAGSTYTSGSTQSAWTSRSNANIMAGTQNLNDTVGNFIEITGVQLEVGRNVTEFEHRSYGEELRLCQRYYTKSYNHDVAPGTNTMVGTRWGRNYDPTDSRSANVVAVSFPVTMRAAPNMTFRGVHTGDTGKWTTGANNPDASNTDMTVNSLYDLSDKGFSTMSSGNIGASNFFGGHYEANAEF